MGGFIKGIVTGVVSFGLGFAVLSVLFPVEEASQVDPALRISEPDPGRAQQSGDAAPVADAPLDPVGSEADSPAAEPGATMPENATPDAAGGSGPVAPEAVEQAVREALAGLESAGDVMAEGQPPVVPTPAGPTPAEPGVATIPQVPGSAEGAIAPVQTQTVTGEADLAAVNNAPTAPTSAPSAPDPAAPVIGEAVMPALDDAPAAPGLTEDAVDPSTMDPALAPEIASPGQGSVAGAQAGPADPIADEGTPLAENNAAPAPVSGPTDAAPPAVADDAAMGDDAQQAQTDAASLPDPDATLTTDETPVTPAIEAPVLPLQPIVGAPVTDPQAQNDAALSGEQAAPPAIDDVSADTTPQAQADPIAPSIDVGPDAVASGDDAQSPDTLAPEILAPEPLAPETAAIEATPNPEPAMPDAVAPEGPLADTVEPAAPGVEATTTQPPETLPPETQPLETLPRVAPMPSGAPGVTVRRGGEGEVSPGLETVEGVTIGRLPSIGAAPAPAPSADDAPDTAPGFDLSLPAYLRFGASIDVLGDARPLGILLFEDASAEDALIDLPMAVTLAMDPFDPDAARRARVYREAGHEIALLARNIPPGATPSDLAVTLNAFFRGFPETVALVDVTTDPIASSRALARELSLMLEPEGYGVIARRRGFDAFLGAAHDAGLAATGIYRVIDDAGQNALTLRRLIDRAAFEAGRSDGILIAGSAGNSETLTVLIDWAQETGREGVMLVPASAVLTSE